MTHVLQDSDCKAKDEDLVVVEAAEENGENVQKEMIRERLVGKTRAWFEGVALAMGIVGLWGDRV